MGDSQIQRLFSLPPPPLLPLQQQTPRRHDSGGQPSSLGVSTPSTGLDFDPSRMIGIIRRKALIKDLAAVYHADCLAYCQEFFELQKNVDETFTHVKAPDEPRRETVRPPKRLKKSR